MSQTDAVLQNDVVRVVFPQDGVNLLGADLSVHLIQFSGPVSQTLIFKVRVVGDGSAGAQLDAGHQLHGAADDGVLLCVLQPLHHRGVGPGATHRVQGGEGME